MKKFLSYQSGRSRSFLDEQDLLFDLFLEFSWPGLQNSLLVQHVFGYWLICHISGILGENDNMLYVQSLAWHLGCFLQLTGVREPREVSGLAAGSDSGMLQGLEKKK